MNGNQWIALGLALCLAGVVVSVQYFYGWGNVGQKIMEAFNFGDMGESFALVLAADTSTQNVAVAPADEGSLVTRLLSRGRDLISRDSEETTTAVLMPVDRKALDELVAYGAISKADAASIDQAMMAFDSNLSGKLPGDESAVQTPDGVLYKIPVVGTVTLRVTSAVKNVVSTPKAKAIDFNPVAFAQFAADKTNTSVELTTMEDNENKTAMKVPLPFDFTNLLRGQGKMGEFSSGSMGIFKDPIARLTYLGKGIIGAIEPLIEDFVGLANNFAVALGLPFTIAVSTSEAKEAKAR